MPNTGRAYEDARSLTSTRHKFALNDHHADTMTLPPPSPSLSRRADNMFIEPKCTSFKLTDDQLAT